MAPAVGGYRSPHRPILDEVEAAEAQGDIARAVELELQLWVDGPNRRPDEVDPRVREKVRLMNTAAFATAGAVTDQPLDPPAMQRLGEIRAPTLLIVGDRDVPDRIDLVHRMEAEIPGAQEAIIPGAAHMVSVEKPQEFNRLVLEFLADCPGSRW